MIRKIKAKGCNVYLIEVERKRYIVDTGLPGSEKEVLRVVDACEGIILTHSHFDHMGSSYFLSRALGCKVFAHPEEFDYLRGFKKHEYRGLLGLLARLYEKVKKPEFLEEVWSIEELEDLEVIHVPGHTPGSISILVESYLICGDLIRGGGFLSKNPGLSSENFNWDSEEYRKSLKKVLKFEFDKLLPGHGRSVSRDEFEKIVKGVVPRV